MHSPRYLGIGLLLVELLITESGTWGDSAGFVNIFRLRASTANHERC